MTRAYPRTSGATCFSRLLPEAIQGLSPHERGNRLAGELVVRVGGPIPARAGQPVDRRCGGYIARAYPRTSGATVAESRDLTDAEGLSPHERGNRPGLGAEGRHDGPIPARAGQPVRLGLLATFSRAYPRTSGATSSIQMLNRSPSGLSPHERGNRSRNAPRRGRHGPIPARAGQPACAT